MKTVPKNELKERLKRHVMVLSDDIGERNISRYPNLVRSASYVDSQFQSFGYQTEKQNYSVHQYKVDNIIASIKGREKPEQIIIVGAHYDTAPGTPGANDNGSGIAALLELARHFANKPLKKTLRFVAFVNEEPPYFKSKFMGSRVYAESCRIKKENIEAMVSLETIGFYTNEKKSQKYPMFFSWFYPNTGNFVGFVGNWSSRSLMHKCISSFKKHSKIPAEGTSAPGWIRGIDWSDHGSFWRSGYKAIMVTDTAPFRYKHYHKHSDTWDKLDYVTMEKVTLGIEAVIASLCE